MLLIIIFCANVLFAQENELVLDSTFMRKLEINGMAHKYIENRLKINKIKNDTLFLSIGNVSKYDKRTGKYLICSNLNALKIFSPLYYSSYLDSGKFKGYFYVNNNCIIVFDDFVDSLDLFSENEMGGKYFTYYRFVMPARGIGYVYLCYFIFIKHNKIKIKKQIERVKPKNIITKYWDGIHQ